MEIWIVLFVSHRIREMPGLSLSSNVREWGGELVEVEPTPHLYGSHTAIYEAQVDVSYLPQREELPAEFGGLSWWRYAFGADDWALGRDFDSEGVASPDAPSWELDEEVRPSEPSVKDLLVAQLSPHEPWIIALIRDEQPIRDEPGLDPLVEGDLGVFAEMLRSELARPREVRRGFQVFHRARADGSTRARG